MTASDIEQWSLRLRSLRPTELFAWSLVLQAYDVSSLPLLCKRWTQWGGRTFRWSLVRELLRLAQSFSVAEVTNDLSWSHYRLLLQIRERRVRQFYLGKSKIERWTVMELQRKIQTDYHLRISGTSTFPSLEHFVLDFIPEPSETMREEQLEKALLNHLEAFLLELGRGFAFVGRQHRIRTEGGKELRIDLVFYHYVLHCFVLVELKVGEMTYRDIGQLDGYVRLFDARYRGTADAPTLGLLLCRGKDEDLARYSMLAERPQLHVATYTVDRWSQKELAKKSLICQS